ncbi:MAG: hypothetical protein L6R42_009012, partial [Xanthoria sp. 1 TBL-2021]
DWMNSSVFLHSTQKPSGAPLLSDSSLWYHQDNDVFYSGFTGRSSLLGDRPEPPPVSIWSFKPDGTGSGTWKVEISPDDPRWKRRTRTDRGYTASGGGSALVLGGVLNPWTTPESVNVTEDIVVPGLVEFNMTRKTLFNSSATGFNAQGIGGRGAMHYVPSFGPNGLFMIMGGTDFSDPDQNTGFDNIWVYETLGNRWYNQTATGAIPAGRRMFCLAGVAYDEIFILTLPAFHWLKVNYPPQHPRQGHSCNAVGGSQIISIGGVDSNAKIKYGDIEEIKRSALNSSVDPFVQGLGIFDMTTLTWANRYTANAPPYEQSDPVKAYYRDNALQDLFSVTHFSQAPSSGSGPSQPRVSSSPSSSNTAAIAGGAVGGFVALALVVCVAFFVHRRRRTQQSQPKSKTNQNTAAELHGSEQQIQEADDDAGMKIPEVQGIEWRPPAELDEVRPEMGYDEASWAPSRPFEMEATELLPSPTTKPLSIERAYLVPPTPMASNDRPPLKSLGSVLVIGGCGFLGSHIVRQLLDSYSCDISVLDLRTTTNRYPNVSYHEGNITSLDSLRPIFSSIKPTVIIHTASPAFTADNQKLHQGKARSLFHSVNVTGTSNLLTCASETRSVKAFIYTSSSSVIHDTISPLRNANESYPVLYSHLQPEY